jgi:hypothetical protein
MERRAARNLRGAPEPGETASSPTLIALIDRRRGKKLLVVWAFHSEGFISVQCAVGRIQLRLSSLSCSATHYFEPEACRDILK